LPQAHLLVCSVSPHRALDAGWVVEVLTYWQQRNYRAYRSHCKRRIAHLNQLK